MKTWPAIILFALLWFLFVGARRAVAAERKVSGKVNEDLAAERREVDELRDALDLAEDDATAKAAEVNDWKRYADWWKARAAELEAELFGHN